MPPQQSERLLDLLDDGLNFGAHINVDLVISGMKRNLGVIARSEATKQSSKARNNHWIASLRSQ
jgi:hypothetical protein